MLWSNGVCVAEHGSVFLIHIMGGETSWNLPLTIQTVGKFTCRLFSILIQNIPNSDFVSTVILDELIWSFIGMWHAQIIQIDMVEFWSFERFKKKEGKFFPSETGMGLFISNEVFKIKHLFHVWTCKQTILTGIFHSV